MVKFNFSISNKQNNFYTNTVEDLPNEIWKEFKGYFVSNMGRIKSIKSGKAKIVFRCCNGRGTLCGGFKWKFYYGDT